MSKKILLINRGSDTDNYGDQAINFTLKKIFEANNCIVDCENYTKIYTRKKNIILSTLQNLRAIIRAAKKNYNLVCIGGGQLILGNGTFPFSFFLWTTCIKIFSNSKIILFAVGVDSSYSRRQKWLIQRAISLCNDIYVRDEVSKVNAKMIFGRDAVLVPDVVCIISKFHRCEKQNRTSNKRLVSFGITKFNSIKRYKHMDISSEEEYFESQAKLLLYYKNDSELKLIYNTKGDYDCSIRFKEYLLNVYNIDIEISMCSDLFEFIRCIVNSDMVISSRMHALIISGSYGTEFLPVERNIKLKAFANEYKPFGKVELYYEQVQKIIGEVLSK